MRHSLSDNAVRSVCTPRLHMQYHRDTPIPSTHRVTCAALGVCLRHALNDFDMRSITLTCTGLTRGTVNVSLHVMHD